MDSRFAINHNYFTVAIIDCKFIVVLKWTGELKLREDITPQTYPRAEGDQS